MFRPSPSALSSTDDPDPDPPPLDDPYVLASPPPARAGVSPLATTSVFAALFLGPLGSILAIVFGWYARREITQRGARRAGYGWATAGLTLGVVLTMFWGGLLSYLASSWRYHALSPTPEPVAVAPAGATDPPPRAPAPAPPPSASPEPGPSAPKVTKVHRQGQITVVDVGVSTAALSEELARQRAEASSAGETMLVMTTAGRCDPCRGVDRSLADPLMQTALSRVRLVRVDLELFHEDLDALKIPHRRFPGFFLLALDLTPKDGIDGGEWDDDIAVNIAPVLGAFVRGKYPTRREAWRPVPGSGMRL
jgi:hypothetical protein